MGTSKGVTTKGLEPRKRGTHAQKLVEKATLNNIKYAGEYSYQQSEEIRKTLLDMKKEGIAITPQNILAEVEGKPDHPLHKFFDWDDSSAAKKYRLQQARCLVNTIKVVTVGDPNAKKETKKAFYSIVTAPANEPDMRYRQYFTTEEVKASPAAMRQMELTALRDFQTLTKKYRELGISSLSEVYAAVDKAGKAITSRR